MVSTRRGARQGGDEAAPTPAKEVSVPRTPAAKKRAAAAAAAAQLEIDAAALESEQGAGPAAEGTPKAAFSSKKRPHSAKASTPGEAARLSSPTPIKMRSVTPSKGRASPGASLPATSPAHAPPSTGKKSKPQSPASTALPGSTHDDSAAAEADAEEGDDEGMDEDMDEDEGEEEEEEGLLDSFSSHPQLSSVLETLQQQASDSSVFLQPSEQLSLTARETARALHRYAVRQLLSGSDKAERGEMLGGSSSSGSGMALLPELYVDSFDAEQIWVQVDTATAAALRRARRLIKKAQGGGSSSVQLIKEEFQESIDAMLAAADGKDLGEDEESEDEESEEEEGESDGEEGSDGGDGDGDFEDALSSEDDDDAREARKKQKQMKKGSKSSSSMGNDEDDEALLPAEDRFMRFSEMEQFISDAEAKAAGGGSDDDEEEDGGEGDEDDEDGDMFGLGGGEGSSDMGMDDGHDDYDEMQGLVDATARLAGGGSTRDGKGSKGKAGSKKSVSGAEARYEDFFGVPKTRNRGVNFREEEAAAAAGKGVDGEDEEKDDMEGGGRKRQRKAAAEESEEEEAGDEGEGEGAEGEESEEEEEAEEGEEGDDAAAASEKGAASKRRKTEKEEALAGLSTHERRLVRMQERIAALETGAMGDKVWTMVGEVASSRRPLNSALEADLDFESSAKPPPAPTEEVMADLEALVKQRIIAGKWDDAVRVVAAPISKTRKDVELDESKSKQGLGELYEEQYVRAAVGGVSEDKDARLRIEANALYKALIAKLDALTHFHFAPKPVIADLNIRSEVAALAMEEAAPVAVSRQAGMMTAVEVFKGAEEGAPKAEGEMSREDRKRRRAAKKRAKQGGDKQKESERKSRTVAQGGDASIAGRKSDTKIVESARVKIGAGANSGKPVGFGKSDFGKSSAVFAKLQEQQDQAKAGIKLPSAKQVKAASERSKLGASTLKL